MRIISGKARGRKLKEPGGHKIRPTSDRVKESVFTIVQFDIEGRRVLDLFAGSGQYGIEALSRDAAFVCFVDTSKEAINLVNENLKICGFSEDAKVYSRDAITYLEYCDGFDLIFIDPPYGTNLADKAVSKIVKFDKLNINGIIICEISADTPSPQVDLPYMLFKEYKYGNVKIVKYVRKDSN